MNTTVKTLPSSEIAVGHCAIINHVDQPCGRLLAIIVAVEGERVRTKYLNAERHLSSFNKRGCVNPIETVTPVGHFGVEVQTEHDGVSTLYWCEPVGESRATYCNGDIRPWQERGLRVRYFARLDVLAWALLALK